MWRKVTYTYRQYGLRGMISVGSLILLFSIPSNAEGWDFSWIIEWNYFFVVLIFGSFLRGQRFYVCRNGEILKQDKIDKFLKPILAIHLFGGIINILYYLFFTP